MATKPTRPAATATSGDSPRFRICAVLAAHGASDLDALVEKTGFDRLKLKNALYLAKKAGVIRGLARSSYEITDQGRRFLTGDFAGADRKFAQARNAKKSQGEPNDFSAAAMRDSPAAMRGSPAAKQFKGRIERDLCRDRRASATTVTGQVELPTFVAAVASDGSFCLVKGGNSVKLDAAEYAEMCAYQQRVGYTPRYNAEKP